MPSDVANLGIKVDSKGVVTATKDLNKLEGAGSKAEKQARSLGKTFAKIATGAAVLKFGSTVIANTIEQERVISQLNATLKSTGRLTPELSKSLQDYASELQGITTFGDEAIISSEALLLTFTRIGGETFNRAQRSILDVATALGTDLKSATIQVGKALNDPIEGMTALSRSGITFTKEQKEIVKSMVAVNDIAGAQGLILNELEKQFEGSAEAARNTLGGAIKSLQNNFGDLLEGDEGSTTAVTQSINELSDTMSSPEVKAGFQVIVTGIFAVINASIKAIALLGDVKDGFDLVFAKDPSIRNQGADGPLDFDFSGQDIPQGKSTALSVPVLNFPTGGKSGSKKSSGKDDDGLGSVIRINFNEELTERNLILERYNDLLLEAENVASQVQTPQQVFEEQVELLNELRETIGRTTGEGLISHEQYVAGVEQANERLKSSTETTTAEMSEFVKQAAANMETALADGFFNIMQGNFDDLGSSWKTTIDRMVSDLIASQLLDFVAGKTGGSSGGSSGENLLTGLIGSFFGGSFEGGGFTGSGSRSGGIDGKGGFPAILHPNETVTDHTRGGGGSGNVNVTINVKGVKDEGALRQSADQIAQRAGASAQRALTRNG